jgi:hypothetical protein
VLTRAEARLAEMAWAASVGAVRYIHYVFRTAAADGELWVNIERSLEPVLSDADYQNALTLRDTIADFLTAEIAQLLMSAGYSTPPPPKAHDLVDGARMAVMAVSPARYNWRVEIENAREALQQFAEQISAHIPNAEDRVLTRILRYARKVLPPLQGVAKLGEAVTGLPFDSVVEAASAIAGTASAPSPYVTPAAVNAHNAAARLIYLEQAIQPAIEDLRNLDRPA